MGGEGEREIFYTMITQYYACYAVLRMLRNSTQFYSCYANITQTLRIDNAIFTQLLRKYNAEITQCLRIYNAMFTQTLRRLYAVITHCYAGVPHVTQIFACYADLCMLRNLYADITRALRSHYADITQLLRKYNAEITQCLRIYNAMFTQTLRRLYAVITHCYAGVPHVTQIFACYADLCMLRNLYADITRALRSHYADITQSLGILP